LGRIRNWIRNFLLVKEDQDPKLLTSMGSESGSKTLDEYGMGSESGSDKNSFGSTTLLLPTGSHLTLKFSYCTGTTCICHLRITSLGKMLVRDDIEASTKLLSSWPPQLVCCDCEERPAKYIILSEVSSCYCL
jgi:hypothetical protein